MLRIVIAPCSPFSVTPDLMRASVELARAYGIQLHTHLAETRDEDQFCLQTFGKRPVPYAEELGWTGPDVWFAHMVHVNTPEIELLARTGCGVAHCPSSNMRLSSGTAPVHRYQDMGVKLGLGVDGSASNDSSHMLSETRQAMLLSRLSQAPDSDKTPSTAMMTPREALEIATIGGAAVLQRDDIGSLEVGKCGDFFALDLNRLAYAGSLHDPVAATILCAPQQADIVVVNGKVVVEKGHIQSLDMDPLIKQHNQIAYEMINQGNTRC